jgi:hypothetical protein
MDVADIEAIEHLAGQAPIIGVCLGHQVIVQVFGENLFRPPTFCGLVISVICLYLCGYLKNNFSFDNKIERITHPSLLG